MKEEQFRNGTAVDIIGLVEHELAFYLEDNHTITREQIETARTLAMAITCSIFSDYLEEDVNWEVTV